MEYLIIDFGSRNDDVADDADAADDDDDVYADADNDNDGKCRQFGCCQWP